MKKLEIIACGSTVAIGSDREPIHGIVNGVSIYGDRIEYQVAWWNGRSRSCEWLDASEGRPAHGTTPETRVVGFAV